MRRDYHLLVMKENCKFVWGGGDIDAAQLLLPSSEASGRGFARTRTRTCIQVFLKVNPKDGCDVKIRNL